MKKYEKAKCEFIALIVNDIITSSGETSTGGIELPGEGVSEDIVATNVGE